MSSLGHNTSSMNYGRQEELARILTILDNHELLMKYAVSNDIVRHNTIEIDKELILQVYSSCQTVS